MKVENLVSIVGAGPAGVAAAIQLKRYGYEPLLFEMDRVGGLLWNANLIENYPGFPKGISGPKFIQLMEKQLKNLQIQVNFQQIENISRNRNIYKLKTGKTEFYTKYLVIASGTKPKPLQIKIPCEISAYVHRDIIKLLPAEGKRIVIVGGGDGAFDHALYLAKKNKITLAIRENIHSVPVLADRVMNESAISVIKNIHIDEIKAGISGGGVSGKAIRVGFNSENTEKLELDCDELVLAFGREPRTEFIDNISETARCFFIGDVKNGIYRQASIAIGDGIMAAMKIHHSITSGVR